MDGVGDSSGWLVLFAGIILLAVVIGWCAARASTLDIRRPAEDPDLQELLDLYNDD